MLAVSRRPLKVEIVQEGDERFIVKTLADGSERREPVVKLPWKKASPAPTILEADLNKGRKKGLSGPNFWRRITKGGVSGEDA